MASILHLFQTCPQLTTPPFPHFFSSLSTLLHPTQLPVGNLGKQASASKHRQAREGKGREVKEVSTQRWERSQQGLGFWGSLGKSRQGAVWVVSSNRSRRGNEGSSSVSSWLDDGPAHPLDGGRNDLTLEPALASSL